MFKRLILEDSAALYFIVGFVTAAAIFLSFTWHAIRMPRAQADKFARLPLADDIADLHEPDA